MLHSVRAPGFYASTTENYMKKLFTGNLRIVQIISISILLLLPFSGSCVELGTRQQTITPTLITNVPGIVVSDLSMYETNGYSSWQWGSGQDKGQLTTNMPSGYLGATNAARLLTFFCFSDIHLTDKESPSWPYWSAYKTPVGFTTNTPPPGDGNSSAYSPVMLSTTHMLDAAVRTANALHRLMPFDFAMSLGDDVNNAQYNELRWFIDIMDGQYITPSSGTNAGANTIDYQMPYQAAGLNPDIPWYQTLGNHDHFWAGSLVVTEYLRASYTNNQILLFGDLDVDGIDSRSHFMGTVDGSTPYGTIIGAGPVADFVVDGVTNTPTVAADSNRYGLTPGTWMNEFFNTTSEPAGHGFSPENVTSNFACYSFEPKTNLPLKVIVLDDTITDEFLDFTNGSSGAVGYLDTNRLNWLTRELHAGQTNNQLMIIAAHIPIEFIGLGGKGISAASLMETLYNYPNLILWVTGHLHRNNIKAHPSPDSDFPEYGFWEVENPSLRDFPQQFRTFEILRNTDNSISIKTTDIDPDVTPGSCADKSRGYSVGAARIFAAPLAAPTNNVNGTWNFADTNSFASNAELLKFLTPTMQTKIAGLGEPLGHRVAIDGNGTGVNVRFLGELQSKNDLRDPAWNEIQGATNSPYTVSAPGGKKFYRAVE
jgi:metallophosphoesterase (TIGR03768 family)